MSDKMTDGTDGTVKHATTDVRVRRGVPDDAGTLTELGERTFRDAFAADNRPEDVEAHTTATYGVDRQALELADPACTYLIAEAPGADAPAGYALVRAGPAPARVGGAAPLEVVRFYVDRRWHGRGVAQALMAAVVAEAERRGAQTLWLSSWERNARGIRFYEKCGFRDVGSHTFWVGSDPQTDRLMARPVHDAAASDSPRSDTRSS
jgi:GNAT superfamily N-acetyltransferase